VVAVHRARAAPRPSRASRGGALIHWQASAPEVQGPAVPFIGKSLRRGKLPRDAVVSIFVWKAGRGMMRH
jgi:hypothetical protein